jgi:ATP-dependent helicase/nuclease subunit B
VLEQQLFSYTSAHFDDPAQTITVHTADDLTAECAWAASRALQLVQAGCRWRDIAIAARGFSDYAPALERMCAYYGVPLYFARRTDLLQKPLVALIRAAYDIVTGGWDAEDVSAYLRTGLAGLTPEETDTLENYVLLWSLRGGAWTRPEPWRQHPDGYGAPDTRRRPWRWQIFSSGCTWRSGSTRSPRICAARGAARSRPNMRSSGS